ncbi:MAG: YggS family pyridoxal phosphate-dependent enzyme [Acidimicrobiia bacterium]
MSLDGVRRRVEAAARRAGRSPDEVTIVAVSKGRAPGAIAELYATGHRDFGENRASELVEKAAQLPDDIRWHFVGHLQSRKARLVRPLAGVLHSLESESTAKAWLKGAGLPPPAYLQVNIGREPQKYGVDPDQTAETVQRFGALGIELRGLMAILPVVEEAEAARPYFQEMVRLRDEIAQQHPQVAGLSMGMTDDFEVAVEEGSTVIRVGRAIFESHSS